MASFFGSARAIPAIAVLLCGLSTRSQAQVLAPPDNAILATLKHENQSCKIDDYKRVFTGRLPGADSPVVVATYTLGACGGGNMVAPTFGVFSGATAGAKDWPLDPMLSGHVSTAIVQNGKIAVTWLSYKPQDPRCCPSDRHHVVYALKGSGVVGIAAR